MRITLAAHALPASARKPFLGGLAAAGAELTVLTADAALRHEFDTSDAPPTRHGSIRIVEGLATDTTALREAARGADALIWRLPTPRRAPGPIEHVWNDAIDAVAETTVLEDVRHVVHVSHYGAWRKTGSALVDTIARAETRLDEVSIHATHLRAGWLLENILVQIPTLRSAGALYLPMHQDTILPVLAASDLGRLVADLVLAGGRGRHVVEAWNEILPIERIVDVLRESTDLHIEFHRLLASAARAFYESLGASESWAAQVVERLVQTDRGNVLPEHAVPTRATDTDAARWTRDVLLPQLTPQRLAS